MAGDRSNDAGFGRARRLLTANDYSRVFDRPDGKAAHRHLLLLARCSNQPRHRLGLVIAKKHVRRAVDRNRLKRLAREFFRRLDDDAPPMDVVLLARPGLGELDNAEVSSILQQQWQKLLRHTRKPHPHHNRDS